jgi:hypothetical protein
VLLRIIISPCLIVRLHDGKSVKNEQPRCSRWKARQWRWKVDKMEASWETRQGLGRTARADAISSPYRCAGHCNSPHPSLDAQGGPSFPQPHQIPMRIQDCCNHLLRCGYCLYWRPKSFTACALFLAFPDAHQAKPSSFLTSSKRHRRWYLFSDSIVSHRWNLPHFSTVPTNSLPL